MELKCCGSGSMCCCGLVGLAPQQLPQHRPAEINAIHCSWWLWLLTNTHISAVVCSTPHMALLLITSRPAENHGEYGLASTSIPLLLLQPGRRLLHPPPPPSTIPSAFQAPLLLDQLISNPPSVPCYFTHLTPGSSSSAARRGANPTLFVCPHPGHNPA